MPNGITEAQIRDLLEGFRKSLELSGVLLALSRQMAEIAGAGRKLTAEELQVYRTCLDQTDATLQQLHEVVSAWPLLMTANDGKVH